MVSVSQAVGKVVIFSPITSNVNVVETYVYKIIMMFLEFQKHQARNRSICPQYLNMSAVQLCTI